MTSNTATSRLPYRVSFVNIGSGREYTAKLATLVDAERYAQRLATHTDTYRDVHVKQV